MPNQLIRETSLYLRQHADNPVSWQPWSGAAFAEAIRRDCPVLLSIGYASCHWCHVMAHESFADAETADQMNAGFVNIKVDREERPDIDRVYQTAHQILQGRSGGWPLTVFLDPKTRLPFFTGTYFPKTSRHQMPTFSDVMARVLEVWQMHRSDLEAQSGQLHKTLRALNTLKPSSDLSDAAQTLVLSCQQLLQLADTQFGGFGQAPKFPMTTALQLLLQGAHFEKPALPDTAELLTHSLTCMARGGIFDHVGGGFFRYSTDQQWTIPHFEKMLYDNGLLLALYVNALSVREDNLFRYTAHRTARWLMREMQTGAGGYSASVDADSETGEGAFYAWHKQTVKGLLDEREYSLVETLFGLDKAANFENKWHLRRTDAWPAVVRRLGLQMDEADTDLQQALSKMEKARAKRPAPARDDKIICAWNGVAIKGMALAGLHLDTPAYLDSACRAVDFIRTHLWQNDKLCGVWDQDQANSLDFLDDYACLLDALVTLLACQWRPQDARFALDLAEVVINRFFDSDAGGFFFTAHDHETLISREKPVYDDMVPSGNALLVDALLRLGHLFAEHRYLAVAEETLRSVSTVFSKHPERHASLVCSLRAFSRHKTAVVVLGAPKQLLPWLAVCRRYPESPGYLIARRPENADCLPPHLSAAFAQNTGQTQAFVCRATDCQLPITDLAEFENMMRHSSV